MNQSSFRLDYHDMQGLIVSGYAKLPCSAYLLLEITEAASARRWLASMAEEITTGGQQPKEVSINIAFTAHGLQRLGLPEALGNNFSFAFREGMAEPHRARVLGDVDKNDSGGWEWEAGRDRIDILLLVYAADFAELERQLDLIRIGCGESGIKAYRTLAAGRPQPRDNEPSSKEHFGFTDGLSQPLIDGDGPFQHVYEKTHRTSHETARVKPGEFILGYEDESKQIAGTATLMVDGTTNWAADAAGFGWNGSYLVFRHLKQDVDAFNDFLAQSTLDSHGNPDPSAAELLGAKMIGRWKDGASLVESATNQRPKSNAFGYAREDPEGLKCPLGAHVRRANPRDCLDLKHPEDALERVQRRRLLRRGRSFGPRRDHSGPDEDRGLYFICLCADLERQFEFVQQAWINSPSFAGLSGEIDPMLGQPSATGCFTVPKEPVPSRVGGLKQFVTVRGGGYFFLPGVHALRMLAQRAY